MSFLAHNKPNIDFGDTIIVYLNGKDIYSQIVEPGKVFQTRFGAVKHADLVGKPYGHKYHAARGHVHILRPTPELWTIALPHRTQILYFADIALITEQLDLRPGSRCIEAGTGSGSLTHSLARTVAPHGRVFTFDFHEKRVQEAQDEFKAHGLSNVIVSAHRDVCGDGFPDHLANSIDAVFLDLPMPMDAIPSAHRSLKVNGRICCFSPCIEQVQKTCQTLEEYHFVDITTMENILRQYDVKKIPFTTSFERHQPPKPSINRGEEVKSDPNAGGDGHDQSSTQTSSETTTKTYITASPIVEGAVGHTGFLTFATKFY